jgi:hypothetical protein
MLRQLATLLWDDGLPPMLPESGDALRSLSRHFLRVALTRAEALREPEWARKEIKAMLMLSERVFASRLRQAVQAADEGLLPP